MASNSNIIEIAKGSLKIPFREAKLNCKILKDCSAEGMLPVSFAPFFSKENIIIKVIGMVTQNKTPGRYGF